MLTKSAATKRPLGGDENLLDSITGIAKKAATSSVFMDKENIAPGKTKATAVKRVPLGDVKVASSNIQQPAKKEKVTEKRVPLGEVQIKQNTKETAAAKVTKAEPVKRKTEESASQIKKLFSLDDDTLKPMQTDLGDLHDDMLDYHKRLANPLDHMHTVLPYDDIDVENAHDPQMVPVYANDIFKYLQEKEQAEHPNPHYLRDQIDLNERMRAMLVDWLVEVHIEFSLLSETLFLAVNLLDRYLSACSAKRKAVARGKLQLVGVATLLIACKVEEVRQVSIEDFLYICNQAFKREEIIQMESNILNTLGFNITAATHLHFLRRLSKAGRSDTVVHTLSKYLIELALVEYSTLQFVPSLVAAAAVWLARRLVLANDPCIWTANLQHYSKYSEQQIMKCVETLNEMLKNREKPEHKDQKAVTRKYYGKSYHQVARVKPLDSLL